jgi:hypothetical protein
LEESDMQISAKQRLLGLAAGSILAAGTVLIPAAVASAADDGGRVGAKVPSLPSKGPYPLPDEIPTDPAEGLPVPIPGDEG